ncbi:hypothetical protein OS493_005657 [Desmophyllum pertusum]|uniref:Uncharacterized protein n=1 Tax=Desmophyllum pertusum TaxID=174260 RepID=A0A9W9YVR6_9CNID|nr:hypothetical protein OS493_005657 [Desmophyllum pertusum]
MLKFLALKFKNQSINEVKPYEPQLFLQGESALEESADEDDELKEINGADKTLLNNNNIHEESLKIKSSFVGQEELEAKENIYTDRDTRTESINSAFLPIEIPARENSAPEKRKWSQVNSHKLLQQFASGNDSSSSDDEIKELCCKKSGPLVLSSSPPGKVTVLSKHSAFSARVRPTTYTSEGHSRKKHRLVFAEDEAFFSRPSLNFEKMQQKSVLIKKHTHGLSRPRPVRIRSISNARHSRSCDPAVLSFKPIQMNTTFSLAPVEEPGFAY